MDLEIKNILNLLNEDKIDCKSALKLINSYNSDKPNNKKARKLKISIYDSKDNKSIRIPAIPFGLLNFLLRLAIRISPSILKRNQHLDKNTRMALEILIDIKEAINILKNYPPCDIVNICEGNHGDEVIISIL